MVALAAFPVVAYGASQRLLVAMRRTRAVVAITIVAAVDASPVLTQAWPVPVIGVLGSAAATFVAFGVLAALQLVVLRRSSRLAAPAPRVAATVVAVVAVAALSLFCRGRTSGTTCGSRWPVAACRGSCSRSAPRSAASPARP